MRYMFLFLLLLASENAYGGTESFTDHADFIAGFIKGFALFGLGFGAMVWFARSQGIDDTTYAREEIWPDDIAFCVPERKYTPVKHPQMLDPESKEYKYFLKSYRGL